MDIGENPLEAIFGENASANPILLPILGGAVFVIIIIMIIFTLKSKGRDDMTEEERQADIQLHADNMQKKADSLGDIYIPAEERYKYDIDNKGRASLKPEYRDLETDGEDNAIDEGNNET